MEQTKEFFYNYHANSGRKFIVLFIAGKQETLTRKQFYQLDNISVELVNGSRYFVRNNVVR